MTGRSGLRDATLVLGSGWLDYVLYMAFQGNPTNVGRRTQSVELLDGDTSLLSLHRTVTIYP